MLRRKAKGTEGWILDEGRMPEPGPLPVPEEEAEDGFTFRLAGLPTGGEVWEIGSMWMGQPFAEGARPFYGKVALCVSLETGEVSEPVIYGGDQGISDQQALRTVFERLAKMRGGLPETLRVESELAEMAFRSLSGASRMRISRDSLELFPVLAQALAGLEEGADG